MDAIKIKYCIKHLLRDTFDAYKGTHHASNNACIGVCVATLLDGLSYCILVRRIWLWELLMTQQKVKAQYKGFLYPPLLASAFDIFVDQINMFLLLLFTI